MAGEPTHEGELVIEAWVLVAVVIVLATLGIDRSRAYRLLPAAVNRLRRWRAG